MRMVIRGIGKYGPTPLLFIEESLTTSFIVGVRIEFEDSVFSVKWRRVIAICICSEERELFHLQSIMARLLQVSLPLHLSVQVWLHVVFITVVDFMKKQRIIYT